MATKTKKQNHLRALREKGVVLSQDEVGKLIGCDMTTVSRHESGERAMTREQILAYAKLYRVPSHALFLVEEAAK